MTKRTMLGAWIVFLVLGLMTTVVAAGFGLRVLRSITETTCSGLTATIEQLKVRAVINATQEFVIDNGRCPSGTAALVADRYLHRSDVRSASGLPLLLTCWNTPDQTFVQVRSAGRDGTFDTADDLVVDSEG